MDWDQYKSTVASLKSGETKLDSLTQRQRENFDRASTVIADYQTAKQQLQRQLHTQQNEIRELQAANAEMARDRDKAVFWGKVGAYGLTAIHATDAAANAAMATGGNAASAVGYAWLAGRSTGEKLMAAYEGANKAIDYVQRDLLGGGTATPSPATPGASPGAGGAAQGAPPTSAGGEERAAARRQPAKARAALQRKSRNRQATT